MFIYCIAYSLLIGSSFIKLIRHCKQGCLHASHRVIKATASGLVGHKQETIDSVGISDSCELYVVILQEPDTFKVTIEFPASIALN